MKTIVLATRNRDKVREIVDVLRGLPARLVPVYEWPEEVPEVEETGDTLEANARLKAEAVAQATGEAALADDTGLEVDALDGAPGVWAARYAGPHATYADNCKKLLHAMRDVGPGDRGAVFRTVVVLAVPGRVVGVVHGVCEGEILTSVHGTGGFGYDPVFRARGAAKSFAEMSLEEKNAISHRARAFAAARILVTRWLEGGGT